MAASHDAHGPPLACSEPAHEAPALSRRGLALQPGNDPLEPALARRASASRRGRTGRAIALAALVLLAGATAAEAKGTVEVCGAARCELVTDPGVVGPLRSTFGPAPAPSAAPFYVVRFCSTPDCRGPIEWSYVYVPSAQVMRADDIGSGRVRWMQASLLRELLGPLTQGLRPYPASATWTPATHTADDRGRRAGSVGLPSLVLAAVIAIAALGGRATMRARRRRGSSSDGSPTPRDGPAVASSTR